MQEKDVLKNQIPKAVNAVSSKLTLTKTGTNTNANHRSRRGQFCTFLQKVKWDPKGDSSVLFNSGANN